MLLPWVYLSSLFLSVIFGFISRRSLRGRLLWFFLPYLFLVFCQETVVQVVYMPRQISTGLIYNIYMPVTTAFFSIFYYRIPVNKKVRNIIPLLLGLYLITVLIVHIYLHFSTTYNLYLFLAGGFVITSCAILFLFNYFSLDSIVEQKKWLPVVWISIGIVVFYPVVNITYALYKQILANNITIWGLKLYQAMPQLMSIFMYSCFAYAFYLCRRTDQN